MFFLLSISFADEIFDDRFYPAEGSRMLSISDLLQQGAVAGRSGRILLALRDPAAILSLQSHPEVKEVEVLRGELLSLHLKPGVDDLALSRKLHEDPAIRWAHPDLIFDLRAQGTPDDPLLPSQWHSERLDLPLAWELASGSGQIIAVLDSGVQADHPDLQVLPGVDLLDDDNDAFPSDGNSHGTGVAGVAAGQGNNGYGVAGVAWAAQVYPVRLIGGATSTQDIYNAITGAVDAGASVINNSWGYGTGCPAVPMTRTFEAMLDYAELRGRGGLGSVITFAAGNDDCDIQANELLAWPSLIVVAATDREDVRVSYSCFGESVDIAAPTGLLTTDLSPGGYGSYDGDDAFSDGFGGTSAATPVVSGVAALMLEANPRLTAAQLREVLCQTATRIDPADAGYNSSGHSPWYGCGLVDGAAAVLAVANQPPSAPVLQGPGEEAWEGRLILSWEAAIDPDGDVLGYELAFNTGTGEQSRLLGPVLAYDLLADTPMDPGTPVTWRLRAIDSWGPGPFSEYGNLLYQETPLESREDEVPASCGHVATGGLGLLGLLAVRRRRSRS